MYVPLRTNCSLWNFLQADLTLTYTVSIQSQLFPIISGFLDKIDFFSGSLMNLAEMSKLKVYNIKHRQHDLKDSGEVLLTMKKNKRLNIDSWWTAPPGWTRGHAPLPVFLRSKQKKGKQKKKRKGFKTVAIKRLSPRPKCYYFNHSRASRIQKFFLSANHGSRQYVSFPMAPPLWNPFRWPC